MFVPLASFFLTGAVSRLGKKVIQGGQMSIAELIGNKGGCSEGI